LAQEIILRAAKDNNSKFIMWVQDFYSIATKIILRKKFLLVSFFVGFLFEFLEKRQVRLSDKLIIISKSFEKKLLTFDRRKNKLFFIPNWGNLKQIKINPLDKDLYKKFGLTNKFRLVYTGTLGLKHNPNLILYIAKKNPDIELVISAAGSGFDNLTDNINLPTNIKLLPLQPFKVFNKILNSADIVFAMLNEEADQFSVPSKILNYHCAGKPIILAAPLNNLSSQIINQSKAGKTFAPNDFKNLNSFLNHLKNNKKLRLKMGKNGRDYAKLNFDIKKITLKFENIFKKII
jgi:glycosyltransferase involved in cell wall biosynthesis